MCLISTVQLYAQYTHAHHMPGAPAMSRHRLMTVGARVLCPGQMAQCNPSVLPAVMPGLTRTLCVYGMHSSISISLLRHHITARKRTVVLANVQFLIPCLWLF